MLMAEVMTKACINILIFLRQVRIVAKKYLDAKR